MTGAQDLRMREMQDEISEPKVMVQTITEKYEAQIQTEPGQSIIWKKK